MEPILEDSDRAEVKKLFQALTGEVFVDLYVRRASAIVMPGQEEEDDRGEEQAIVEQLLGEVAGLSPKVTLAVHDVRSAPVPEGLVGIVPAIVFRSPTSKGTLRYFGVPAGYEFKTLVEAIVALGRADSGLSAGSRAALSTITRPVNLKVYVTPSCPYCPASALMAFSMAMENGQVTADVVEAQEFPEMAQKDRVSGVPKTVIEAGGGRSEFVGALPEDDQVAAVVGASAS